MKQRIKGIKRLLSTKFQHGMLACVFGVFTFNSAVADVDIASVPPSLSGGVAPNIMFIIDDSGSMQFELPESQFDSGTDYLFPPVADMYGENIYSSRIFDFDEDNPRGRYFRSNSNNPFYYNPEKVYEPWYRGDRSQWDDSDPEAAPYFPGISGSDTLDLTERQRWYYWVEYDGSGNDDNDYDNENDWEYYWPVTYYVKKGESLSSWARSSYYRYQIRNGVGYRKDLATGNEVTLSEFAFGDVDTRTVDQELQNFANWFSYYRSRTLAARSGIGNAFSQQPENMRVGYGRLNKGSSDVDGVSTRTIVNGVRLFEGSNREQFFNSLYTDKTPNEGTPLRVALKRAGEYFERTDNRGPWGAEPGTNNSTDHLECRQSFTILMTDGYWSGTSNPNVGNADDDDGVAIGDYDGYVAEAPFKDDHSNTLADVAMHYWKRDLRPNLDNKVPTSGLNPAFWQHMVTFGVGLGVEGTFSYPGEKDPFAEIGKENPVFDWIDPTTDENAKVDDLLHAAVNSRGGFFSAADPDTFATELSGVLSDIVDRVENSTTSAAASSAVFRQGALSYSAGFRSTDWSGAVQAAQIMTGGGRGKLIWDAERQLHMTVEDSGHGARNLFTNDGSGGVAFNNLNSLSTTQQAALNTALDGTNDGLGEDRIDWLRGDNSANGSFRDRESQSEGSTETYLRLIGDIIGSNPQYAGKTNFGYRRLPGTEGSSYAVFRASEDYRDRPDVIYVGANDGFLHAFHSLTGDELFAYMPGDFLEPEDGSSHAVINELMDPQYDHRYYVDGTPTITDAYIGGQWRTILVGTTGAGGKTVFALDVTDPESFSASDVLWEFTHDELGYGVSDASIVRLTNGTWAVVFGNGYNSDSHGSSLFVVNLENGNLIQRISAGTGTDAEPNGMAAPVLMADRTEGNAIRAYAGDLQGNLWRFDLDSGTMTSTLLFEATDDNDDPQPITASPKLAYVPHGSNSEVMVVFGTGSFFRVSDSGDNQEQSLYGIADDGSKSGLDRADLQDQSITEGTQSYTVEADGSTETKTMDVRTLSDNALGNTDDGWVVDLDTVSGERVVSPAGFPSGYPVTRVRFSTLIPETNVCSAGQEGYLMDIDLATGGQTKNTVFDLNRDGEFDAGDAAAGSQIVNGVRNVVAGERISVILGDGTDIFLDSELVPVPNDYDGHEEVDEENGETGTGGGGGGGGDDDCDADALFCGDAEGFRFGRQNWEELR